MLTLALLFTGCATDPNTKHFYLGSNVQVGNIQIDPVNRTIKGDTQNQAKTDWIGISRTPLLGIDFIGLKGAPWIGCRLGYLLDLGADMGFACATQDLSDPRMDVTFGLDYNLFGKDILATAHFEQNINGEPLKFGYGACFVW